MERSQLDVLAGSHAAVYPELGVRVAFTGRQGGVSVPPYDSLNLSGWVGDDDRAVSENRRRAEVLGGFAPGSLALVKQVHGATVVDAGDTCGVIGEGDAVLVRSSGVTAGVLTADCVPVLLVGPDGAVAAHAGWRGLVGGVIENAISSIGGVAAAWIGPAIGACCYEVGPEVVAAFEDARLPVTDPDHVDPAEAAAVIVEREGAGRLWTAAVCTSCDERFFSYRANGPVTGRQAGLIAWV